MNFKKILFLPEKSFYSVEEFMTIDPWTLKIVLMMYFTLSLFVLYTCILHWLVFYVLYKDTSYILLISSIITSIVISCLMYPLSFCNNV
jgi:hypothetical protein